jgi:hypothetical protein
MHLNTLPARLGSAGNQLLKRECVTTTFLFNNGGDLTKYGS